jgi:hypothetical protein
VKNILFGSLGCSFEKIIIIKKTQEKCQKEGKKNMSAEELPPILVEIWYCFIFLVVADVCFCFVFCWLHENIVFVDVDTFILFFCGGL